MDFLGVGRSRRDALLVEPARLVVPFQLARLGPIDVPGGEDLVGIADALQALHLRREPGALGRGSPALALLPLPPVEGADPHRVPRGDELPGLLVDDDAGEDPVEAVPDLVGVGPQGLDQVADDRRVGLGVVDDLDAAEVLFFEGDVVVDLGVADVFFCFFLFFFVFFGFDDVFVVENERGREREGRWVSDRGRREEERERKKERKEERKLKKKTHRAHARRLPGSPRTKGCLSFDLVFVCWRFFYCSSE